MRKLVRVITVGAFLAALAFASAANAQSLGQIAGPLPVGTQASFNGAKCVLRAHQYHANRTLRIRRDDGTIVAHWQGPTSAGNDYVLMASFFQLGGAGSRAVCEAFPVNVQQNFSGGQDVADAQLTLQTLTWIGNTIETVTGVSGNIAGGPPTQEPTQELFFSSTEFGEAYGERDVVNDGVVLVTGFADGFDVVPAINSLVANPLSASQPSEFASQPILTGTPDEPFIDVDIFPTAVGTILAIAYTDIDPGDGDGFKDGVDVLIAKLVDTNGDGVVSIGDTVVTDRYPTSYSADQFGDFTVTSHEVAEVVSSTPTEIRVRITP